MENTYKRYTITEEEVKNNPFTLIVDGKCHTLPFYELAQSKIGEQIGEPNWDCREINVSEDIQDSWYEYVEENGLSPVDFTMLLAVYGPKVNHELPERTFEVTDKFLY